MKKQTKAEIRYDYAIAITFLLVGFNLGWAIWS